MSLCRRGFGSLIVFALLGISGCVDFARPSGVASRFGMDAGEDVGIVARDTENEIATPRPPPADGGSSPEVRPPQDLAGPGTMTIDSGTGKDTAIPTSDATPSPDTASPRLLAQGDSCAAGSACASGNCVDGVCCNTSCTAACAACNLPASRGVCSPEAANTSCGAATCAAGVAQGESRCNGTGQCMAGATTTCSPYACSGMSCRSTCSASGDCAATFTCNGNVCAPAGLLLYWAFDEDGGNTVADGSGNGRTGTVFGDGSSRPQSTYPGAPLKFTNPNSRAFVGSESQGVTGGPIPSVIKSNLELTLATWFRATAVQPDGTDLVALGSDYLLRIRSDRVDWLRRKSTVSGQMYSLASATTSIVLDGGWHHLAGTSGASGIKLYIDGTLVASATLAAPTLFIGPDEIGVGHQPGSILHYHTGQIDEVRIYGRVLSADEITNLSRGNR